MEKEQVRAELMREPFVPLRVHLRNGKRYNISFRAMTHMLEYGLLIFIGMKEGTRQAKAFDRFGFDAIDRIEQRPGAKGGRKRKRAS